MTNLKRPTRSLYRKMHVIQIETSVREQNHHIATLIFKKKDEYGIGSRSFGVSGFHLMLEPAKPHLLK